MPSKEYYENRKQLLAEVAKKRNLKQTEQPNHIISSEHQLPERKMSWKYAGMLTLMLLSGGYFSRSSKLPKECEGFAGFSDVGNNDWRTSKNIELYTGGNDPALSDATCAAALFVQSAHLTAPDKWSQAHFFQKNGNTVVNPMLDRGLSRIFCKEVTLNREKIKPPRNGSHLTDPCYVSNKVGQLKGGDPDKFGLYLFPGPTVMVKRGYPKHQPETKGAAMLARR